MSKTLRRALVVCVWRNTQLPRVLKSAGLDVTVLCADEVVDGMDPRYDGWIRAEPGRRGESPKSAMIRQVGRLFANDPRAYDWVFYDDDSLLAALRDSELRPDLKVRFSPIRAVQHLALLHSKRETMRFLREAGFASPESASCDSFGEILCAGAEIGFPLLVKIEGTNGGKGVFKADSPARLLSLEPLVSGKKVLVERFLPGPTVAIDALFLRGELAAYNYSLHTKTDGPFGISYERRFLPCRGVAADLSRMGKELQLDCFTTISCILEEFSGRHVFFEVDFRSNAWIGYGRLVGADFAAAIRDFVPGRSRCDIAMRTTSVDRVIPHLGRDVRISFARRDWGRLLAWALNQNRCWQTVDPDDFRRVRLVLGERLRGVLGARHHNSFSNRTG